MCYKSWQAIVYDRVQYFNTGKSFYLTRDMAYYAQIQSDLWYRISSESIDHIFVADPRRGQTEEISIVDLLSDINLGYLQVLGTLRTWTSRWARSSKRPT